MKNNWLQLLPARIGKIKREKPTQINQLLRYASAMRNYFTWSSSFSWCQEYWVLRIP
jgi:hypothetical protein